MKDSPGKETGKGLKESQRAKRKKKKRNDRKESARHKWESGRSVINKRTRGRVKRAEERERARAGRNKSASAQIKKSNRETPTKIDIHHPQSDREKKSGDDRLPYDTDRRWTAAYTVEPGWIPVGMGGRWWSDWWSGWWGRGWVWVWCLYTRPVVGPVRDASSAGSLFCVQCVSLSLSLSRG